MIISWVIWRKVLAALTMSKCHIKWESNRLSHGFSIAMYIAWNNNQKSRNNNINYSNTNNELYFYIEKNVCYYM